MSELTNEGLLKLDLDDGVYRVAKAKGLNFNEFCEQQEEGAGYVPEGDFAKLTAYERQLMAHDIEIGNERLKVEDFYKTGDSSILFPPWVEQQIYIGMDQGEPVVSLADLAGTRHRVKEGSAKGVAIDLAGTDTKSRKVAEGSRFPRVQINTKEKSKSLIKVGCEFDVTDEALRRMKVLQASHVLRMIGTDLASQIAANAIKVMRAGDGNPSTAAIPSTTIVSGVWSYADLVSVILPQFEEGRLIPNATHVLLNLAFLERMLSDKTNFPQLQSQGILEGFIQTGKVKDIGGKKWRVHPEMEDEVMLYWNQPLALDLFEDAAGQMVESEKIIREGIHATVIQYHFAFVKAWTNASQVKTKKA